MIYLDHAATTPPCPQAIEAFAAAPFGNPSSAHAAGQAARKALEQARERIANCLGANPSEVYFTSGATEACNWAVRIIESTCKGAIVLPESHHAVLDSDTLSAVEQVEPCDCGFLGMVANNETGEIYRNEDAANAKLVFLDATAAAGHILIDFHASAADYMALTAHKLGGFPGIGCLLAKHRAPIPPMLHGGGQERGARGGTESAALACAFAAALEAAMNRLPETHTMALRDRLITALLEIPGTHLNGPWTPGNCRNRLPGNINISFEGLEGSAMALLLDKEGICISTGSACTTGDLRPSHVLQALGVPDDLARGTIRITLSHENTRDEIDAAAEAITRLAALLRGL